MHIHKTKPRNLKYVEAVTTTHQQVSQKNENGHKMQETFANFTSYPG